MTTPKADGDRLHAPVLLEEILAFLYPEQGQWIIDGTLGFGGHTERLLDAGAHVIGVDQDPEALSKARERLAPFETTFHPVHGNASDLPTLLPEHGLPQEVDAILFDLGVSSWQLDQAERGFSFQNDGPLDMRMNPHEDTTAADLVNELPEKELADLLWTLGEERVSRGIARGIVRRRVEQPFATTRDLAQLVSSCVRKSGKIHPATRTFQALRIAVNRELERLPQMLEQSISLLKPGGKLAVISFHSLEDRLVKRFLRKHSQPMIDDPTWPEPRKNPDYHFDLPSKLIQPTADEAKRNPRARSAKLRFAVRRAS